MRFKLFKRQFGEFEKIQKICMKYFALSIKVEKILLNNVSTGNNSFTTVFKNDHNEIFALCNSSDNLLLADVKDIIKKMGMRPEFYYPPNGNDQYFIDFARLSFQTVFPGRKQPSEQDLAYYKTFSPYLPALVKISKIDGEIKQLDTSLGAWTNAINYSYSRIKVEEL